MKRLLGPLIMLALSAGGRAYGQVAPVATTIPPPKSSEGTAAKEQLNQFTSSLSKTVDSAKSAIAQLGSNPSASTITAALVGLAPQVTKLTDDLRSTVDSLRPILSAASRPGSSAGGSARLP